MLAGGLYGIRQPTWTLPPELTGNAYASGLPGRAPDPAGGACRLRRSRPSPVPSFGDEVVDHYTNMADVLSSSAFDAAVTDWELQRSLRADATAPNASEFNLSEQGHLERPKEK